MLEARPLSELLGEPVASYISQHSIAAKVCGRAQWTQADKQFAFDRNSGAGTSNNSSAIANVVCEEDRPYDRLPVKTYMRRQSQLPLQY
jgi:ribonuclease HII